MAEINYVSIDDAIKLAQKLPKWNLECVDYGSGVSLINYTGTDPAVSNLSLVITRYEDGKDNVKDYGILINSNGALVSDPKLRLPSSLPTKRHREQNLWEKMEKLYTLVNTKYICAELERTRTFLSQ